MKKDLVIVRVDGGVVSQLHFVALGKMFEKQGFEVKYDISWYEKDSHHFYSKDKGYDRDYTLSWDIPKIFPKLEFQIASKEEIKRHKKKYKLDDEAALTYKRPMYIDQYNLMGSCDIAPICEKLKKDFSVVELGKDEKFTNLAHEIESTQSCGVHVRRGDLSKDHIVYGRASDVSYFVKSIDLARKINKELKKLYLFSDDKAWVRQNLCPHLKDIEYMLCDVSTPENGYLDLYLLSKCKIIIGSQGGMGGVLSSWQGMKPCLSVQSSF